MTSLRAIKHNLTLVVGATMLAASLVLLTLFGLVAVVIPAALAILGMELARARRWLRDPK
jgi:predicted branched-subunit amino acid permease